MSWQPYSLDRIAQKLVIKYRDREVLNESHKMRMTVAYGLERFWGEHLRLRKEAEGQYWKDVWAALVNQILQPANILLPNDPVNIEEPPRQETKEQKAAREARNTEQIKNMANKLWEFADEHPDDQRIALAVLTQLCDCLVWWTQRYKPKN
ncbi:hypothetical protein [Merismopedia glauca]|uniref:CRISPR type III-B/RAMP module-associated protein Cmr5 n=1 Tax=Merismopedia glauca CCAP 1448/3 TaxID=1296344 RepID=A0A2T1C1H6_9CYAN|nr:hypothetical protein [Merismopedia glauca]PSB02111.1 hypothetical protein C7B64_14910 [Merismopedia glauca CCAP 1448/3]